MKSTCPKCDGPAEYHVVMSMAFWYEMQDHWDCPKCGWVPQSDEEGRWINYDKENQGEGKNI